MMLTHVYDFSRFLDGLKSCFYNVFGSTDKSDNSAICGFSGIDVQEFYTIYSLNAISNLTNNILISSFTEIGYTLYYLSILNHKIKMF